MKLSRLADWLSGCFVHRSFDAIVRALMSGCALVLLASCASISRPTEKVQHILFIGNSVIYTNNLPAVFERIADGQPDATAYEVDMFARGGATLTELSQDPRVPDLLKSGRYDVVVLQEKGGDDLCLVISRDSPDCAALVNSHVSLANLAREHGAKVLYLGTYQLAPGASRALVRAERLLGDQMTAQYVEVSERLQGLRESEPGLPWLHADGGHPGIATTALMGSLIYEALNASAPVPFDLCIGAEMYAPKWKHDDIARHVDIVSEVQPKRCLLSQSQMHSIIQGAEVTQPVINERPGF